MRPCAERLLSYHDAPRHHIGHARSDFRPATVPTARQVMMPPQCFFLRAAPREQRAQASHACRQALVSLKSRRAISPSEMAAGIEALCHILSFRRCDAPTRFDAAADFRRRYISGLHALFFFHRGLQPLSDNMKLPAPILIHAASPSRVISPPAEMSRHARVIDFALMTGRHHFHLMRAIAILSFHDYF